MQDALEQKQEIIRRFQNIGSEPKSTKRALPVKLTKALVDKYASQDKGYRISDSVVTGLILYVGLSGTKSWSIVYTDRSGKRQTYRIGSAQQFDVISARVQAKKLLADVSEDKTLHS
jgi:hypothetical protein